MTDLTPEMERVMASLRARLNKKSDVDDARHKSASSPRTRKESPSAFPYNKLAGLSEHDRVWAAPKRQSETHATAYRAIPLRVKS